MAKKAFEGVPGYDKDLAVTISQDQLNQLGVKHSTITGQQNKLYTAFAKSGQTLTLEAMKDIEIEALINAGVPADYAKRAVGEAYVQLKNSGVNPVRIPWN